MHEALASFKMLLNKILTFENAHQAAMSDIDHVIQTHSVKPNTHLDQAITNIADMMSLANDRNLNLLKSSLEQFLACHQQGMNEVKVANSKIEKIILSAQNEFIEDIRAEFNIPAISEYGLRVIEKSKQTLNSIDTLYQADVKEINWTWKDLKNELPETMASVGAYNATEALLLQVKNGIYKNNQEINDALFALNDCANLMSECMKKANAINVVERLNGLIYKLIFKIAINDNESKNALLQIYDNLKKLNSIYKHEDIPIDFDWVSIDDLYGNYSDLLISIELIKDSFINKNIFGFSLKKELIETVTGILNKTSAYQTAIEVAKIAANKHSNNYNQAYENTYAAIQQLGNLAKAKLKNDTFLTNAIPTMEKIIAERKKIKIREDNYLVERYQFNNGFYDKVDKEGFVKIKERFLYTNESKNILNDLLKHANGHMLKGGLIKSFIAFIESTKSLADLIAIVETATHRRDLIDCKTDAGRKFGIISTTAKLVKRLDVELKKLIIEERKINKSFDSVKIAIEEDKAIIFSENIKYNFSVIYKDFLESIGKQFGSESVMQSLKEELVSISLWQGNNEGKVCRMAIAMAQMKKELGQQIKTAGDPANLICVGLNRFMVKHIQALKTVPEQQQSAPFSYRYQELRKRLSTVNTLRKKTLDDMWNALDRVAVNDDEEPRKLESMRQVIYGFYCGIRESSRGSPGYLFGNGSRLAAALGEFLTAKEGFYMRAGDVPLRIGFRL